jgi:hypothetical protein
MTTLGEKAVALAQGLIRCPSVTPKDAGALDVLIEPLKKARFVCDRLTFTEEDTPAIFVSVGIPTWCRRATRHCGDIHRLLRRSKAACFTAAAPPT